MTPADIARSLRDRLEALLDELLPGGRREGWEWRCGSVSGEEGQSLAVHLAGQKRGVWADFATGETGDTLDLVVAALGLSMGEALAWSGRWLGIDAGEAKLPKRRASPAPVTAEPASNPDRWHRPWRVSRAIGSTIAERYLSARGLQFDDPEGRVLRFHPRRARLSLDGEFECGPAMLAALCDARTAEQCGCINVYLQPDGRDRVRDSKGKTVTGRARGAVVMLSAFDEPTMGLVLCEGVETGVAIHQAEMRPIWACGGAGTLATFPVLGGIEALTICADADKPGQRAAEALAERWRAAGRDVNIVPPPAGDWAAPK